MANKIIENNEDDLINFESEFNIKDEDFKFLKSTHEKANVKKLKHYIKEIDQSIDKIEDGLLEIIYTVDELLDKYESGEIFKDECGEAVEKLFTLNHFISKMQNNFNAMKDTKDDI